jgi:nucleotide-binding universal stress UspA family protein
MTPTPIRTILVATDLDGDHDEGVATAGLLAERLGARLHLVHVIGSGSGWLEGGPRPELVRRVGAARTRMEAIAAADLPEGVPVELHIGAGRAYREILDHAGRLRPELIVVGTGRSGAVGAHFLGSTAERVLVGAGVPCLVVRERLRIRVGSIGVPIDAFDPSDGAAQEALRWALRLGEPDAAAPVRLVYAGWELDRADDPSIEERLVLPALRAVAERSAGVELGAGPAPVLGIEVVWGGDPATDVVRWADREGVGLLVVGSRAETGIRRLLGGSVAQSIARRAPCPVLLVPAGGSPYGAGTPAPAAG